jgi:hypothetical protein
MPTTSNFGFDYPESTDFVKDGAEDIQALADGIDARFGASAFPNQIVNVVSGVSRPVPYATAAGKSSVNMVAVNNTSVTVTFPASRFSVAPVVNFSVNRVTSNSAETYATRMQSLTSSSVLLAMITRTATAITETVEFNWIAMQVTSTTAAG